MKAFEVLINGQKVCVAGVSDDAQLTSILYDAQLTSILSWVGDKPRLHVGGLENEEHLRWLERNSVELNVGDEVTFRILETDAIDAPVNRSRSRTRAAKETEVRGHLTAARDLLPLSLNESDVTGIGAYNKWLEQGHLIGAVDALGAIGEINIVPAEFWRELSHACHNLSQYEDSGRYSKKWQEAKQASGAE